MNLEELKSMFTSIGENELATLLMHGCIGRIRTELSEVVANAQKAQGVAERAELAAQVALNSANSEIAAAKVEIEKLVDEKASLVSELAALKAQHQQLEPKVSALREADKSYASKLAALGVKNG